MKVSIGLADDQQLFVKSLSLMINSFPGFDVTVDALNGKQLIDKLEHLGHEPNILLIDVHMPEMDGETTVTKVAERFPRVKCVALSIKADDMTVIKMIRAGCCAYLLKDIHPTELEKALNEIAIKGYYNADVANINYRRLILREQQEQRIHMTEKEKIFLKMACSDLTYHEIADRMCLSEKTIDGYRASLFEKLNVKSRVGMALEALKQNLVQL